MKSYVLAVFVAGVSLGACSRAQTSASAAVTPQTGPLELAVPNRTNANVTLASDGDRVAAAWAASGPSGTDIYVARSADGGRTFAGPVRVNDVEGDASANGEQPPRAVLKGNAVDVVWVSKRGGVAGIRSAASTDGGTTFAPARTITPPGLTGARGWESAVLADDGTVHAAWLDGRNATPPAGGAHRVHDAHGAHAEHAMTQGDSRQDIYHAMWRGTDAPVETPVASNVCFCCKTAIVSRGADVYVAWRHLFPGGVRDIAVAHSADNGRTFSAPVRVSADNWKIDACPDDGPSMTLDARHALHVVWPTLVQDAGAPRMAIFEATSGDGGATFSPRARVDAGTAAPSHPRIATDGAARSAIVWDELAEGRRRVLWRPAGAAVATAVSTGRIASYPSVAATLDGFVVAWTDQADNRSVIHLLRVR